MACCEKCGASIPDAARFCPKCGRLSGSSTNSQIGASAAHALRQLSYALIACFAYYLVAILIVNVWLPSNSHAATAYFSLLSLMGIIYVVLNRFFGRNRICSWLLLSSTTVLLIFSTWFLLLYFGILLIYSSEWAPLFVQLANLLALAVIDAICIAIYVQYARFRHHRRDQTKN